MPDDPSQKLRQNHYNLVMYNIIDLGTTELGHYILFEGGFLRYQAQQDNMFEQSSTTLGPAGMGGRTQITSKMQLVQYQSICQYICQM